MLAQIVALLVAAGALIAGVASLAVYVLWLLAAAMVLYACCTVIAAFTAARKHGWEVLPFLPFLFPVYHYAYGLGFTCGLVYSAMGSRNQKFRPGAFYGLSR